MKKEEGIVIDLNGNLAKIKVGRHNECKNCGACPGDNTLIIEALNKINANKGDRVIYRVNERNMVLSAFVVFFLPIMLIFAAICLANALHFHIAIGIFSALLISSIIIKVFDKKTNSNSLPQILEKL